MALNSDFVSECVDEALRLLNLFGSFVQEFILKKEQEFHLKNIACIELDLNFDKKLIAYKPIMQVFHLTEISKNIFKPAGQFSTSLPREFLSSRVFRAPNIIHPPPKPHLLWRLLNL